MTPARPHIALVRLVFAFAILLVGVVGGDSGLWSTDDGDGVAAAEFEPESEQDPEPEDDRDDDDDDALARTDVDGVDSFSTATPATTNKFAHPSCELDRLFRPPIA